MTPDIKLNRNISRFYGLAPRNCLFSSATVANPIRLWCQEGTLLFVIQKLWGVYLISLGAFL